MGIFTRDLEADENDRSAAYHWIAAWDTIKTRCMGKAVGFGHRKAGESSEPLLMDVNWPNGEFLNVRVVWPEAPTTIRHYEVSLRVLSTPDPYRRWDEE